MDIGNVLRSEMQALSSVIFTIGSFQLMPRIDGTAERRTPLLSAVFKAGEDAGVLMEL